MVIALAASVMLTAPAQAFNLGQLTTLSRLGEPLRLEFEVLDLSAADVDSFKVTLASPEAFALRGLGYDRSLQDLSLRLVRTDMGRLVIRIEGQRPVADPFVDLLLNISWASGASTRAVSVSLATASGGLSTGAPSQSPQAPAQPPQVAATPAQAPSLAVSVTDPQTPSETLVVQRGDTAGELVQRVRPADAAPSQYLLALARHNPAAFVEGNVNRLRAGASLSLPTQAQVQATSAPEAQMILTAQWQEFQAFRQQLATRQAAAAPDRPVAQAQGQVESLRIRPSEPTPSDTLTLSKPTTQTTQGGSEAEQKLLNERQAQDADARLKELDRTLRELGQVQSQAGGGSSSVETPPAGAPTDGLTAALPAPQPAASVNLIDQLSDHPAVLPAAGGLLALALAWLGFRLRRQTDPQDEESAFEADRLTVPLSRALKLPPEVVSYPPPTGERRDAPGLEPRRTSEPAPKLDLELELDLDDETYRSGNAQARAKETKTP